jgi:peptide subunit release factor 1 (eRF1)
MSQLLSAEDKFDIQQNFRRYMRLKDSHELANEAFKAAKANRIWIAGIILLLFALASDFFLGAAAGLFGV